MNEIVCNGKSLKYFPRKESCLLSKRILRQIFRPLADKDLKPQHEVANHYKDYLKRKKLRKLRRRSTKRLSFIPIKSTVIRPTREVLNIPSFLFPR